MNNHPFILFRILTSMIFIYAGSNHILQSGKIFSRISKSVVYQFIPDENLFRISIMISGIIMVAGGIALLIGYKVKLAATVLIIMLAGITLTVQLNNLSDLGPFFKNVAIAGSLLFIINYKSNDKKNSLTGSSNVSFQFNKLRTGRSG